MTTDSNNDENNNKPAGTGDGKPTGSTPTPPPAGAGGNGTGGTDNDDGTKLTGASDGKKTTASTAQKVRSNVGGIALRLLAAAVFVPPIFHGVHQSAVYGESLLTNGQTTFGTAFNTAVSRTKAWWLVPISLTAAAAKGTYDAVSYPLQSLGGLTGVGGVQATEVVYCHPKLRNTGGLDNESALRTYTESIRLEERARTLAEVEGGQVERMLQAGGFPVITGYFSDTSNGMPTHTVMVENAGSANAQTCPVGDFQPQQRWPVRAP